MLYDDWRFLRGAIFYVTTYLRLINLQRLPENPYHALEPLLLRLCL